MHAWCVCVCVCVWREGGAKIMSANAYDVLHQLADTRMMAM